MPLGGRWPLTAVYKPVDPIARWFLRLQLISGGVLLIQTVFSFLCVKIYYEYALGQEFDNHTYYIVDKTYQNLGYIMWPIWGVSIALMMWWMFRGYGNLHAMRVPGLQFAAKWVVIGWLIPLVNFVVPYRIMSELYRGSDPKLAADPAPPLNTIKVPWTIKLWWACVLLDMLLGELSRYYERQLASSWGANWEYVTSTLVIVAGNIVALGELFLLIGITQQITARLAAGYQLREEKSRLSETAALQTEPVQPLSP